MHFKHNNLTTSTSLIESQLFIPVVVSFPNKSQLQEFGEECRLDVAVASQYMAHWNQEVSRLHPQQVGLRRPTAMYMSLYVGTSPLDHHACCAHAGGEGERCTTLATSSAHSQPDQPHDGPLKGNAFEVADRLLLGRLVDEVGLG